MAENKEMENWNVRRWGEWLAGFEIGWFINWNTIHWCIIWEQFHSKEHARCRLGNKVIKEHSSQYHYSLSVLWFDFDVCPHLLYHHDYWLDLFLHSAAHVSQFWYYSPHNWHYCNVKAGWRLIWVCSRCQHDGAAQPSHFLGKFAHSLWWCAWGLVLFLWSSWLYPQP